MISLIRSFLFATAVFLAAPAFAEGLFYDTCIEKAEASGGLFLLAVDRSGVGLTCDQLNQLQEAYETTKLVLWPASLAVLLTPARAEIAAQLELLGLGLSNPAVLGVTVIGAFGVVTVYFVLKAAMEDCERMDRQRLREEIVREIERKYRLDASRATFEVKR